MQASAAAARTCTAHSAHENITSKLAAKSFSRFAHNNLLPSRSQVSVHSSKQRTNRLNKRAPTSESGDQQRQTMPAMCACHMRHERQTHASSCKVGSGRTCCSSLCTAVLCATDLSAFRGVSSDHSTRATRSATRAPATSRALAASTLPPPPAIANQEDYLNVAFVNLQRSL